MSQARRNSKLAYDVTQGSRRGSRKASRSVVSGKVESPNMYAGDGNDNETELYSDEEMPAAERELAEDAQWKLIQKNTFTRWCNEHLKTVNKHLALLETDFADGLRLIALVEVLSAKKFKHINKRPNFRSQKLENVSMCLKFLEDDEGIKIVNIDSTDIVDAKLKLILGLVWTLILHYSISTPMWDGEEDMPQAQAKEGPTPKQRLLMWVQNKLPDLPVKNFTTDWNNGKAIGGLVDACGPGLCPDWQDWDEKQPKRNATEAMDLAEKWLDVPQLIKPEEMINPKIDELSMMTYLAQFPKATLKQGAPLRPKTNAARVRAYGPGLEPSGCNMGAPAKFTVETFSAGRGDVTVQVTCPTGVTEECQVVFNNDRNLTYSCQYEPTMEGEYTVTISFAGKEIPKSPYKVNVEGAAGDPTKVTAEGPGLQKAGVVCGKKTNFEVYTSEAGVGNVEVVIIDPRGHKDTTKPRIAKTTESTYYVEYMARETGRYSVHIYFAGKEIPSSPYNVGVADPVDPKKCYASGRGVQAKGIRVGDTPQFLVHTEGAGEGKLEVTLVLPGRFPKGGKEQPIRCRQIDAHTYEAEYKPTAVGDHILNITYGGAHIQKSPFKVNVDVPMKSAIRVYGPGLEGGVANKPADFVVETYGETGALGFAIEGPSQAKISCNDNGDGSADVSYLPTVPGEYAVHILCNDKDIPDSPFMAQVAPASKDFYPEKVVCSGQALSPDGVVQNEVATFTVDTTAAGRAPLKVTGRDKDGNPLDVQVKDNKDGTYACQFVPKEPGKHTVVVSYGGVNVPRSPFRIEVDEPTQPDKVKVFGPGVEEVNKTFTPTYFFVDCTEAGPGDVAIELTDERGLDVGVQADDNGDAMFRIEYEPRSVGVYSARVIFGDQEIPASPYRIVVEPNVDVSKVQVANLEPHIPVKQEFEFDIVTKGAGRAPMSVNIRTPSGRTVMPIVTEDADGFTARFTPQEVGRYDISISFGGQPVPGGPFSTSAVAPVQERMDAQKAPAPQQQRRQPVDESAIPASTAPAVKLAQTTAASKVRAYGEGLEKGVTTKPAEFIIDTKEAGSGGLGLTIEGPMEARMEARDNGDGTCHVYYYPTEAGQYTINIMYCNEPIPKSPWVAKIEPGKVLDVSGVKVYGDGVKTTGVFVDSPTDFTVDATSVTPVGEGKVRAIVTNPSGTKNDTTVTNNKDGTYTVAYAPYEEGPHGVDVTYEGLPVPKSPFPVEVVPGCDPTKVKAYGPGLEGGVTNQPQEFTIETRGAGQGGLNLAVEGPSKAEVTCEDNRDGTCTVEYVPVKAGNYEVAIKFADEDIPGSPFKIPIVDVVDPSKCRAYGPGVDPEGVRATEPARFTVDCTEAGKADLAVKYNDGTERAAEVLEVDEDVYQVTYYPAEEGQCTIDATYGGQPVAWSPLKQTVLPATDPSKVKVTGEGVQPHGVKASLPTNFLIDTRDAGTADVDVSVQGPEGPYLRPKVIDNGDGTVTGEYTPEEVGEYQVKVKFGGEPVPGSPFRVNTEPTGDATKVTIGDGMKKKVVVGEECVIIVNTSEAGPGNITCRIRTPTDTDADIDIEENGDGTVSVYYTPRSPGAYGISIKFGGMPIPEGAYTVQAVDPSQMAVDEEAVIASEADGVQSMRPDNTFHPVDFVIPVGPVFANVSAKVETPSGQLDHPRVVDNGDGSVTIKYVPTETGLHSLYIDYNGENVEGSPYQFHVDAVDSGLVSAYGPGLSYGVSGEPCSFTINTKNAGAAGLALAVEGPSKAEIQLIELDDGTHEVNYYPSAPGLYKVVVKSDDNHIPGSPFTAYIAAGDGPAKEKTVAMGAASEFALQIKDVDVSQLTANIEAPSGREEPCVLKKLPNGHLGIKFTPHETGLHLVNVYRDEQHIAGSPFKINVTKSEVGDASKVRVYGDALERGTANELNAFTVDSSDAGYGGLNLSIEGPGKADIDCKDQPDGTCQVTYKPSEPGTYTINIKFAEEHVPGSPFTCNIGGVPSSSLVEEITRQQMLADVTHVGSVCELSLKIPGSDPMEMVASVTAPSGVTELCDILDQSEEHYTIKFVPKEMGVHTVCVKHKGLHIPGSPFQFTVGPITEGGAHKVHAAGPGLERGEIEHDNEFNIYTREAGSGGLAISVEGPSKAKIKFEDKKDGSSVVNYVCTEPGEYMVSVKFNEEHIPDSPFRVPINPHSGEARKVTVQGLQQHNLEVGKPTAFTTVCNGAEGQLNARVVAPSGAEDEAYITSIDDTDGHHAIRFIPRENGMHYVHVTLNKKHIRGSPFKVLVGETNPDPGMVSAYGKGLSEGQTDTNNKFVVRTAGAGASSLSVTVDGPSKVALSCTESADGYEFSYKPTAPGDYFITIKYGGNTHIAGSPFKAKITGAGKASPHAEQAHCVVETVDKVSAPRVQMPKLNSDASKVTSKGNGLNKAFVNKKAQFTVDTSLAGQNMLFVGVIGPAGAPPCDEVIIKHQKLNAYHVSYMVKEHGKYMLIVKWGDEHIPGSPFTIDVV